MMSNIEKMLEKTPLPVVEPYSLSVIYKRPPTPLGIWERRKLQRFNRRKRFFWGFFFFSFFNFLPNQNSFPANPDLFTFVTTPQRIITTHFILIKDFPSKGDYTSELHPGRNKSNPTEKSKMLSKHSKDPHCLPLLFDSGFNYKPAISGQ